MTSAFSWQNSVTLCPASFCTPRPNLDIYNKQQGSKTLNIKNVLTKKKKQLSFVHIFFFQIINSHNHKETKWQPIHMTETNFISTVSFLMLYPLY